MIEANVLCLHCNYNLRGLPADGRCPECGAAVGPSLAAFAAGGLPAADARRAGRAAGLLVVATGAAVAAGTTMWPWRDTVIPGFVLSLAAWCAALAGAWSIPAVRGAARWRRVAVVAGTLATAGPAAIAFAGVLSSQYQRPLFVWGLPLVSLVATVAIFVALARAAGVARRPRLVTWMVVTGVSVAATQLAVMLVLGPPGGYRDPVMAVRAGAPPGIGYAWVVGYVARRLRGDWPLDTSAFVLVGTLTLATALSVVVLYRFARAMRAKVINTGEP